MIPYGRQSISEADIEAVNKVLRSDYLTQGKIVPEFEQAVCNYTGARYGVAVNSGTSALHIACLALGLKEGDYLWTTPITFVASSNCGRYCGAEVDFVDINENSWNIDVGRLKEKLLVAEKENTLPKVLVVVHFAGLAADLEEIRELSNHYGFYVIEDACHALGARYRDLAVGGCQYSEITVFSFHPVKSITSGEGGMALTNDRQLAETMRLLSCHGITRNPDKMNRHIDGAWYYEQIMLGYNYRMSDIHAALGISQLKRLDEFVQHRSRIAETYHRELKRLPLQLPLIAGDHHSAYHLYTVVLTDGSALSRDELFSKMREREIGVNVHYIPVHTQPYYKKSGHQSGTYPKAENYYQRALTLPCFPGLQYSEQKYVIDTLTELLT